MSGTEIQFSLLFNVVPFNVSPSCSSYSGCEVLQVYSVIPLQALLSQNVCGTFGTSVILSAIYYHNIGLVYLLSYKVSFRAFFRPFASVFLS